MGEIDSRRGAYTATRAAALSGVPWSTVHEWARKEVLVPSVSPARTKLWSYTDLMGLRTIYWLRHPKEARDGGRVPGTSMTKVRRALDALSSLDLELWENDAPRVQVDRSGEIVVTARDTALVPESGQSVLSDVLDLLSPFEAGDGSVGPDLVKPRPRLRIVPGKLAGAPHIQRTRLETEALASLAQRNVSRENVYRLYPSFDAHAIDEALDLEAQLERNSAQLEAA